MTGFFHFVQDLKLALHSDTSLKLPTGQFLYGRFGSSPSWGAESRSDDRLFHFVQDLKLALQADCFAKMIHRNIS
jgi:hypothetical protein